MIDGAEQSYSDGETDKSGAHSDEPRLWDEFVEQEVTRIPEEVDDDLRMDDLYYADREEWEEYVESTSTRDEDETEHGAVETYPKFPKITRLYSDVCISEKIDGTNGLIHVAKDGMVRAGSRNRWLYIDHDNHGFCAWVSANYSELAKLGPGHHYGEWYGNGIQRGYGLTEKRFALFNPTTDISNINVPTLTKVPVLYSGTFSQQVLRAAEMELLCGGSKAAEGFVDPEGFMVYFTKAKLYLKVPLN